VAQVNELQSKLQALQELCDRQQQDLMQVLRSSLNEYNLDIGKRRRESVKIIGRVYQQGPERTGFEV
jgi:hypothetical protein